MSSINSPLLKRLFESFQAQRLGHALLLQIPNPPAPDLLESDIPAFFQAMLCERSDLKTKACLECPSCYYFEKRELLTHSHPDFLWLQPEKEKGYSVEQLRSVKKFFQLKKSSSKARVLCLPDADLLLPSSGNALLKFFEEPNSDVYIFLLTSRPERVLETIKSRCHRYVLATASHTSQEEWTEWRSLLDWIERGAPSQSSFSCPADQESFWSKRKTALSNSQNVFTYCWKHYAEIQLNLNLSLESKRKVSDFFNAWEQTLFRIENYGNAMNNWMSLKLMAKEDHLWNL